MKQEITLEVVDERGTGVLVHVAQTLHTRQLPPECFVWSAIPETGEARIWITISEHETKLRELTAELGQIAGMRRIALHGPGQSIKEALILPADYQ